MTAANGIFAYIARAEDHLRRARQSWDPCSLSGCEQCNRHLQDAIEMMQGARQSASRHPAAPGARARLVRLRDEVETMSRLVDSAIAFSRGLALRVAGEELVHSELKG